MAVRILHGADFHLDSPFRSLTEEQARLRRREMRELLGDIADLAREEKSQLVLLSGDLFDSSAAYWETQEMLTDFLKRLSVPVFIAPGNHDYYSSRCPYVSMDLPENVHVFRTPRLVPMEIPELGVRVWGAGYTSPVCDDVMRGFSVGRSNLIELMVLHGEVGGDRYCPIKEEEIAASGLSYLALGHVHSFSGIRQAGRTVYAWPGCPEGRGFDETGKKGVIVGTVGKDKADLRFVPTSRREYKVMNVDLTGCEDAVTAVLAAVGTQERDNVVRFVLTGEYEGAVDVKGVAAALEGRCFALEVRDDTRLARDIWQGADEDSLKGIFLHRLRERYEETTSDREREEIRLAARYGIAALEQREAWRP